MTAPEPLEVPQLRPDAPSLRPAGDPPVGARRLLFSVVLLGLGLLVGGITLLVGGGENVVAARVGFAILLLVVGLVLLARRPSLATGGLALLLGLLLRANPFYGELSADWPWQHWLSYGALDHQLDVALWVGVAVLALLRAYRARGRGLVVGAVFLGLLAAVRTHAEGGGMPLLRNEERLDLTWTLSIAALGAAALLLARGANGVRRSAATLAVLGACFAATIYLAWFPPTEGGSMAQQYFRRALQNWDALVTSADASPQVREGVLKDTLGRIAPWWCMAASLPLLLVAALFPRPTRLSRLLGATAFGLLLLRWIVPTISILYFQRDLLGVRGPSIVSSTVGNALAGAGLAAWLLLSSIFCVALEGGAQALPTSPPRRASGGEWQPAPRVTYAIALGLLLVTMYAAYNPMSGTVAMAWPWNLTWSPLWSLPTAGVVLGAVAVAAVGIALLLRPGHLRAVVALGGLLVGLAALAGPDPRAFLYGVRPLVPQVLLALAVGGAVAVRGGAGGRLAKGLPWAASLLLLIVLCYPLPVPSRTATASTEYHGTIGGIVLDIRQAGTSQALRDVLTTVYVPGLVLLSLGVLLFSTLGARGPGRRPITLWVLFGATLAYPLLHTAFVATDPLTRVGGPVEAFLRRLSQDLNVFYVPHAVGIAAATIDLLLPWGSPAPALLRGDPPAPSVPPEQGWAPAS